MKPLIAFVGPSGSGKTGIMMDVLQRFSERFEAIPSLTTRMSRETDDDKLFYRFKTREEIERAQQRGDLLQCSDYAGNLYADEFKLVNDILRRVPGFKAMVEDGVRNFLNAGYDVIVVKVAPTGGALTADSQRRVEDEVRNNSGLHIDFTLNNVFDSQDPAAAIQRSADAVERFLAERKY